MLVRYNMPRLSDINECKYKVDSLDEYTKTNVERSLGHLYSIHIIRYVHYNGLVLNSASKNIKNMNPRHIITNKHFSRLLSS